MRPGAPVVRAARLSVGAIAAMDNERPVLDPGEERRVARFLSDHPDWLATRTELYRRMAPPRRVHGEALADHMAAMIEAARQRAALMTEQAETVLQAGRAAIGLGERVREAVLALIRAGDIAECVEADLPRLLGIDGAALCVEIRAGAGAAAGAGAEPRPGTAPAGLRAVPPATVARLLGGRDVRLRAAPADAALLHGAAAGLAAYDALVRVPAAGLPPMLLALASRDVPILQAGLEAGLEAGSGGSAALAFLGQAMAARLETRPA